MKREGIPLLPQRRTPAIQAKLDARKEKEFEEYGHFCWLNIQPGNLPEELRRLDKDLFLKGNMYDGQPEVWLRPGGKPIEDDRHQPNDEYIMSCGGLSSREILKNLWSMSEMNRNRLTHDDVDKMEDKAHREALYGTDDDRARTRDTAEKFAVDVGVKGHKFLKGGRPSSRLI